MIAPTVSVLRTIKARGRGMRHDDMDDCTVHQHRHIGMGFGAEAEEVLGLGTVVLRREKVSEHVLPKKLPEGADLILSDRVFGEERHGVLPRMDTVAKSIIAIGPTAEGMITSAITIEIDASRYPCVGGQSETVRIPKTLRQQTDSLTGRIVIHLVDQQNVRIRAAHNLEDRLNLLAPALTKVAQQPPTLGSVKRDIEGGDADIAGPGLSDVFGSRLWHCISGRRSIASTASR